MGIRPFAKLLAALMANLLFKLAKQKGRSRQQPEVVEQYTHLKTLRFLATIRCIEPEAGGMMKTMTSLQWIWMERGVVRGTAGETIDGEGASCHSAGKVTSGLGTRDSGLGT
jgi:hypothetical protein